MRTNFYSVPGNITAEPIARERIRSGITKVRQESSAPASPAHRPDITSALIGADKPRKFPAPRGGG